MSLRFSCIALAVVAVALLAGGCSEKPDQPPADDPNPPVEENSQEDLNVSETQSGQAIGGSEKPDQPPAADPNSLVEEDWEEDLPVSDTQSGKSGRSIGRVFRKVAAEKDADAGDEPSGFGAALSEVPSLVGEAAGQIAPAEGDEAPADGEQE